MPPVAPSNLKAEVVNETSIKLTWNAIGNAITYNVYQDEEMIATVELPSYTVEGLEKSTEYCFTVTAVNQAGESEKSDVVCKTLGEGVEEFASSFNIYPNPVQDKLYIETQTLTQTLTIEIYDVYGRLQDYMTTRQQACVEVDVTDLNSGVYFVKVVTENGEAVKRIIKD